MRPATHTPKRLNTEHDIKIIAHVAKYLWPRDKPEVKLRVSISLFLLILAKLLNVSIPFLMKHAVDRLSVPADMFTLPLFTILAYGTARIGTKLFSELRDLIFVRVAQATLRTMAVETFQHLHRLSLRFHLDRRIGGLNRIIDRGLRGGQFVLSFLTFNIVPTLFEIVLVVITLSWALPLAYCGITIGTIVVYIAFTLLVTEWRTGYRREMNIKETEASSKATDSLINYETVKFFSNEDHECQRFDAARQSYETAALRSQSLMLLLNGGQGTIISLGLLWVMVLAAMDIERGVLTVGDFVLSNTMLIQLFAPLSFLGFVYREMKQGVIDLENMVVLSKEELEVKDKPEASDFKVDHGEIEFRDVHFSYDKERPILKGVSFKVAAGETLAIVGKTGAGKTTIPRLLFRFYDISKGAILVDGQDIREVRQTSLRKNIAMVPQDTVLFNDTIEYNVRYGNLAATDSERDECIQQAQLADFLAELPNGLQTKVGERGLKLSGGEKQRLGIARALLKNCQIMIFDEATSALDSKTEKEIQNSIIEIAQKSTTIIIAHRLSTVIHADRIIVLDHGQIIEQGTHNELLDAHGTYSELWQQQINGHEQE